MADGANNAGLIVRIFDIPKQLAMECISSVLTS